MGRRQAKPKTDLAADTRSVQSARVTRPTANVNSRSAAAAAAAAAARGDTSAPSGSTRSHAVPHARVVVDDVDDGLDYSQVEVNENGGSFCDQFLATLERTIQQKKRDWVSTVLEMGIPLIFILGTIILWLAFGDEKYDEANYLDASLQSVGYFQASYKDLFCTNSTDTQSYTGIDLCQNLTAFDCDGDESTIPITGLCARENSTAVVGMFLNSLLGTAAAVPALDTIIMMQWAMQKASMSTDAASTALLSSGLAANTRYNALASSGYIHLAPASKIPDNFVMSMNSASQLFSLVHGEIPDSRGGGNYGRVFDTVDAAIDFVRSGQNRTWAVIEFKEWDADNFDVVLHLNTSALPSLASTVDPSYAGGFQFDRAELYIASGFATLQRTLYSIYLSSMIDYPSPEDIAPFLVSFGSGGYTYKTLLVQAAPLVAFILVLSFLYPVSQLSKRLVLEKELRIREAMMIMGLRSFPLYFTWFLVYALQYLVECLLMALLLKVTYIRSSDVMTVFLFFYLFALTTIPLAGLIASFFSKARLASMMAPLIFFAMSVPVFAFTSSSAEAVIGFSVFSPTAFASLASEVLTVEAGEGYTARDFHNDVLVPESWILLIMLGADFVLYYLLMVYFDLVLPKDWGTTKNPFFCIIDPFKACCCRRNDDYVQGENEDGRAEDGIFEDVDNSDATVNILGLRKEFKRNGKTFLAVNNFYWAMKEREITVLLGHNGAGKTTVMNMMTGMMEPDEGDCYINGFSVRDDLNLVRQQIGFCPQHNILWPELTCREHLEFFAKIKGMSGPILEEAVRVILREVDLLEKIDQRSNSLSGGQKRKLSVAIAFVGRSALVFLDEPTAGMDVGARRYTWELLRRMSESHTILLTTHYMDEADLLGHRIGIMSQGCLQCSGSSMFLKSRLGVGYNMIVSVDPDADAEQIDGLVTSKVPSAEAADFNGVEIIYKLPMADVQLFPSLLSELEDNGEEVGIRGFSLSATTLEEVFLQIALDDMYKGDDASGDSALSEESIKAQNNQVWNCELLPKRSSVLWSQFKASMVKRFWNALRDHRMQCFQIICPVVCILLAMLLTLVNFRKTGVQSYVADLMYDEVSEMIVSNCSSLLGDIGGTTQRGVSVVDMPFVSVTDMGNYTADTYKVHAMPRYISMMCNSGFLPLGDRTDAEVQQYLFYNTSVYHSAGLVLNLFFDYVLQQATNNASRSLKTTAATLPETDADKSKQGGVQSILIGAIVMIPFTFLPANPIAWVVKERECKSRHLQSISGLSFYIYWLTNFLFDMVAYLVTLILVLLIFLIFSRKEYVSASTIGPTVVMFIVYGLCSTVAAYALSFAFSEHSSAQTITMGVSFVSGFLLVMMVFILSLVEKTQTASDYLRWPFRLVPSYCVGECIINMAMEYQKVLIGESTAPWSMDLVGWPCVFMAAEFPIFVFLTLFIDHPRRRLWGQSSRYDRAAPAEVIGDEDSDVEDERTAVYEAEAASINEDIVRVVDLRKVYDNGKVAVRNLAFSILPDEVFGFLGTNGAGKTTAISMLCQEFVPTSGSAFVCGYDVVDQSQEALACIGYCPQFDACLDLLTVEDHLYLFAGVHGIAYEQRDDIVQALMRLCDITDYRTTCASQLSGGNRRKLSVALSLMGSPQIVFLDEPSAGMDPVARRGLWTTIQRVAQNCSVVLTTHHLEEVETLADTVAIMADGALRCIGDKIHLKNKYGSGFEMSLRTAHKGHNEEVFAFIEKHFPEAVLNECKGQRFVYALPQDTKLSEAFAILQANKDVLAITDYSVSQTSIEQVFLRISEEQDFRASQETGDMVKFTRSHATRQDYCGNATATEKGGRGTRSEKNASRRANRQANTAAPGLSANAMAAYRNRTQAVMAAPGDGVSQRSQQSQRSAATGRSRVVQVAPPTATNVEDDGDMASSYSYAPSRQPVRRTGSAYSNMSGRGGGAPQNPYANPLSDAGYNNGHGAANAAADPYAYGNNAGGAYY